MPISATGSHSCVFSRRRRRSGLSGARTIRLLIMHQKIAGPRDPIILVVRPGLQMGVMYCHPPPDRGVDTVGGRESHGSPRKKCRSCQVWVAYQSAERKCPPRRARKARRPLTGKTILGHLGPAGPTPSVRRHVTTSTVKLESGTGYPTTQGADRGIYRQSGISRQSYQANRDVPLAGV